MKIYKFEIVPGTNTFDFPPDYKILRADWQVEFVQKKNDIFPHARTMNLWVMGSFDARLHTARTTIKVFATGETLPVNVTDFRYLGSPVSDYLVYHVFEDRKDPNICDVWGPEFTGRAD